MARRKHNLGTPSKSDSRLNLALRAGKSIKSLTGFVNISKDEGEPVYAKVSCVGFNAADEGCECRTELSIRGKVVGTGSIITFSPCNWLDTLKEVESDNDLNRRKANAHREYRELLNHHYLARKRLALSSFILDRLKQDDRKAVNEDITERKLTLNALDDQQVKDYARKVTLIANAVSPEDAERYYD